MYALLQCYLHNYQRSRTHFHLPCLLVGGGGVGASVVISSRLAGDDGQGERGCGGTNKLKEVIQRSTLITTFSHHSLFWGLVILLYLTGQQRWMLKECVVPELPSYRGWHHSLFWGLVILLYLTGQQRWMLKECVVPELPSYRGWHHSLFWGLVILLYLTGQQRWMLKECVVPELPSYRGQHHSLFWGLVILLYLTGQQRWMLKECVPKLPTLQQGPALLNAKGKVILFLNVHALELPSYRDH